MTNDGRKKMKLNFWWTSLLRSRSLRLCSGTASSVEQSGDVSLPSDTVQDDVFDPALRRETQYRTKAQTRRKLVE